MATKRSNDAVGSESKDTVGSYGDKQVHEPMEKTRTIFVILLCRRSIESDFSIVYSGDYVDDEHSNAYARAIAELITPEIQKEKRCVFSVAKVTANILFNGTPR